MSFLLSHQAVACHFNFGNSLVLQELSAAFQVLLDSGGAMAFERESILVKPLQEHDLPHIHLQLVHLFETIYAFYVLLN